MLTPDGAILPPGEWPDAASVAVKSYKTRVIEREDMTETVTEIQLHPKVPALLALHRFHEIEGKTGDRGGETVVVVVGGVDG